ncbi:fibronectin type III domain-containing protein [Kribbella sp. NPDC026611]|uniref:fibronectin type III domain-containing protein n=1 Tax=Kribbella sp. NPDC026611 TaxID=3154911 RepID=UPI00340AEFA0
MLSPIPRLVAAVVITGGSLVAAPSVAAAATDVTPPSVPQNLHVSGEDRGQAIISWDPSTDDSGTVRHYWVLVDGQQRARPTATTYDIETLVLLCRITSGPHDITVEAVDPSLNRSAQSAPLGITVR